MSEKYVEALRREPQQGIVECNPESTSDSSVLRCYPLTFSEIEYLRTEKERPRRRAGSIPIALRIAISVIICVAGVGVWYWIQAFRQLAAIEQLEALKARVETRRALPAWLRAAVGDQELMLFDDVIAVDLSKRKITNETLHSLSRFGDLQELCLSPTYSPAGRISGQVSMYLDFDPSGE
ncbi:MAG: hypothetical protein JSS02_21510 [Planctomycetes bacterium]|nr:hypothetical protein [Planctomycetota bacterium]